MARGAGKRTPLGDSGISVPPLGVGTWAWGQRFIWHYGDEYGEEDVRAVYREALDAGLHLFDTAEIYGRGASEQLIGKFMAEYPDARPVVSTKFNPATRFSKRGFRKALEASLERLGLDAIDLYQVHIPVSPLNIEVWAEAMADAHDEGLVRAVGVSNFDAKQMERARVVLGKRCVPLATNQIQLSLLHRKHEKSGLLECCADEHITPLAYSPLAQGLLTGKYTPENRPTGHRHGRWTPRRIGRLEPLLEQMRKAGDAHGGKTLGQVAINWVIQKGALPLVGMKTPAHLREALGALGWKLRKTEIAALDDISAPLQDIVRSFW